MHPIISDFISKMFYEGHIKTAATVIENLKEFSFIEYN